MVSFTEYALSEHTVYPESGSSVLTIGAPDLTLIYLRFPDSQLIDFDLGLRDCRVSNSVEHCFQMLIHSNEPMSAILQIPQLPVEPRYSTARIVRLQISDEAFHSVDFRPYMRLKGWSSILKDLTASFQDRRVAVDAIVVLNLQCVGEN